MSDSMQLEVMAKKTDHQLQRQRSQVGKKKLWFPNYFFLDSI